LPEKSRGEGSFGLVLCLDRAAGTRKEGVAGGGDIVRATGAPDSRRILSNITVYNYDTTHLQENSQRLG